MFLFIRGSMVNLAKVTRITTRASYGDHYVDLRLEDGSSVVYSTHASAEEAEEAMKQIAAGDFSRLGESVNA